jgi:hypothetical protein
MREGRGPQLLLGPTVQRVLDEVEKRSESAPDTSESEEEAVTLNQEEIACADYRGGEGEEGGA